MANPAAPLVSNGSGIVVDLLIDTSANPAPGYYKRGINAQTVGGAGSKMADHAIGTHVDGETMATVNKNVVAIAGVDGTTIRKIVVNSRGNPVVDDGYALSGQGNQQIAVTSTRIQITTSSNPCRLVIVKARKANTAIIYVGTSTVTNNTTASTGGYQLDASESVAIPVTNLNLVYINGTSGDGVSYLWFNWA